MELPRTAASGRRHARHIRLVFVADKLEKGGHSLSTGCQLAASALEDVCDLGHEFLCRSPEEDRQNDESKPAPKMRQ